MKKAILDKKENISIKYNKPEILMIDCEEEISKRLKEQGFNVEVGSFGQKYKIRDSYMKNSCIFNGDIDNIVEKDVVIIDMRQRRTDEIPNLQNLQLQEDGVYITSHSNQKEFNPINFASKFNYESKFSKLKTKDSVFIIFADKEVKEKYIIADVKDSYYSTRDIAISNYDFLPFNVNIVNNIEYKKYKDVSKGIFEDILKNYKWNINSKCTFSINSYQEKSTVRLIENEYGELTGYAQLFMNDNKSKSMLFMLPQCQRMDVIIENILTETLPYFYPEIFKDFVKDTWMNKEEYIIPEVKKLIKQKENIDNEYNEKLQEIEKEINKKKEENQFLYNIISSSGTGDKLVENIIKCLEFLEYTKIEDYDKVKKEGEKEEDLHIYTNEEKYFIAEVKGVNGPAIEDDCNVIVKYKSRNCDKLGIPSIHGVVFVNYHKNVEPNEREEWGFTKNEIKDAERDKYTLVGTYQLFKAIRLCQERIITKEDVKKSLETPGIFNAIPKTFEKLGKIENILDEKNVICIPLECEKIEVNDNILIVEGNDYYKAKVLSMQVDNKNKEKAVKGDKVGIITDKEVPNTKSAQIWLIK